MSLCHNNLACQAIYSKLKTADLQEAVKQRAALLVAACRCTPYRMPPAGTHRQPRPLLHSPRTRCKVSHCCGLLPAHTAPVGETTGMRAQRHGCGKSASWRLSATTFLVYWSGIKVTAPDMSESAFPAICRSDENSSPMQSQLTGQLNNRTVQQSQPTWLQQATRRRGRTAGARTSPGRRA